MSKIVDSYSGKTEGGTPYNVTVFKRDSKIPDAVVDTSPAINTSRNTGYTFLLAVALILFLLAMLSKPTNPEIAASKEQE